MTSGRWCDGRHSSRSERMSTPTLGFGWNDVAFSGSRRPSAAIRSDQVEVGCRHQHGDARSVREPAERIVDRVVVLDAARSRAASAGSRSSCSTSTAARSARQVQLDGRPAVAVGGDQGVRGQSARTRRPRSTGCEAAPTAGRPRRGRRASTPGQDPVDRAEEERGVVLVDQHRQARGRWRRRVLAAASAGRPRSGGGRRRSGPGVGQAVVDGGRAAAVSRIAQTRWRWLGAVDELVDRRRRAAPGRTSSRTRPGPRCTSRIGAGLSCQLGHPVGELGGLGGVDALVRERPRDPRAAWPGARCRGRRPGRGR